MPTSYYKTVWSYEVWFEGNCICSDEGYETEDDAQEMAEDAIESYLEEWPDTVKDDYEIKVHDYRYWFESTEGLY